MILKEPISNIPSQVTGNIAHLPESSATETELTTAIEPTAESSMHDDKYEDDSESREQAQKHQSHNDDEQELSLYKPGDTFRILGNSEDFAIVSTGNNAYLKHINGGVITLGANLERKYVQFNNQSAHLNAVLKAKIDRIEKNKAQDSSLEDESVTTPLAEDTLTKYQLRNKQGITSGPLTPKDRLADHPAISAYTESTSEQKFSNSERYEEAEKKIASSSLIPSEKQSSEDETSYGPNGSLQRVILLPNSKSIKV